MKFRMLLLIGVLFASCIPKAAGLSYSPEAFLSWEEVVADSDFVGVIECVRAGAHVSEFVVVDSWKGTIEQPSFRLQSANQVGDRNLAALCSRTPSPPHLETIELVLSPIGGIEWHLGLWPEEGPDYHRTSPISGSIFSIPHGVEEETDGPALRNQFMTPRFETLKKQAQAVMESSGEAREALLIVRALAHQRKHSAAPGEAPGPDLVDRDERQLNKLLTVLLGPHTDPDRQCIAGALSRAGGKETLARLEAWTYEREADRVWLEMVITRLRHYESARHTPHQPKQPPPIQIVMGTREAREALENSLANYEPPSRKPLNLWCDALEVMTARNPYYVATYLRDFDPSVFYGYMAGQNIAVWYATHVRQDRVRCFQTLATAKHPGIALAGAAYLLHEDSVLGTRTLESWADANGPLRRPAAQLLVAHGQLDFVPVMFEPTPPTIVQESIWQSFQAAMAALSNAAHYAKVPQPLRAQGTAPTDATQDSVLSWWQAYGQKLTPKPLPVQWPPPAE